MQLSYRSHVGILFQHMYSLKSCTLQDLHAPPTKMGGFTEEFVQATEAIKGLVGLSDEDRLFGNNSPKKVYVLTKKAKEVVDNIAVSRLLPITRIQALLKTPRCICLSPGVAYFVWAHADTVKVIYFQTRLHEGQAFVSNAHFDLTKVYELLEVFSDSEGEDRVARDGYKGAIQDLIRVLIFLELTEPEIIVVAAGKKHGQAPIGYSNSSASKIFIVDSTWNKFIVRTEGFGVRGHFRLQPYGERSQELKLIWIDAFQKNGYVRKPRGEDGGAQ